MIFLFHWIVYFFTEKFKIRFSLISGTNLLAYPRCTFVSTIIFFFLNIKILFISKILNFWSLNNLKNAHFDWKVHQLWIIWANLQGIYYSPSYFSQSFNMSDFLIFLSILIFTFVRPVLKKSQKKYTQWLWKRYLL